MYREVRREKIIDLLRQQDSVSVNYLSEYFSVTKETIRADLSYLQNNGLVIRHHGGVSLKKHLMQMDLSQASELNFRYLKPAHHPNEKINFHNNGKRNMNGKVCVFGSFNVDIVAKVKRFPKNGETLVAKETTLGPGGKGANQALAAHCAGAKVHFATKVGKDQFQQFARSHFQSCGIESVSLYESGKAATGSAVIYVNEDGDNIIAISPGANQQVTDEEVAELLPYITESNVVLVQLENNFKALQEVIKLSNALNVQVILNPAPYMPDVDFLLPMIDLITPNETEASQISGMDITDIPSAKEAAMVIHRKGAKKVLITMGGQGALIFDGEKFTHIPAFSAVVVDTTGAGDAFNGALAASLATGKELSQAAYYATAFASLAVEREGAANMPSEHQVAARIIQQHVPINLI